MPLAAGKDKFIQHLINAEDPPAATQQEAANRFVDGYITFIGNSIAGPVPIVILSLQTPTARETFESSLLLAYQATDAVTFCDKAEAAIQAFYLACGGAATLFTAGPNTATGFLFPTPLKQYWLANLGPPTTDSRGAKEKVVSGIIQWKAASQVIFPPTPGGIGPQAWV